LRDLTQLSSTQQLFQAQLTRQHQELLQPHRKSRQNQSQKRRNKLVKIKRKSLLVKMVVIGEICRIINNLNSNNSSNINNNNHSSITINISRDHIKVIRIKMVVINNMNKEEATKAEVVEEEKAAMEVVEATVDVVAMVVMAATEEMVAVEAMAVEEATVEALEEEVANTNKKGK
jgi:hypothetical protein